MIPTTVKVAVPLKPGPVTASVDGQTMEDLGIDALNLKDDHEWRSAPKSSLRATDGFRMRLHESNHTAVLGTGSGSLVQERKVLLKGWAESAREHHQGGEGQR